MGHGTTLKHLTLAVTAGVLAGFAATPVLAQTVWERHMQMHTGPDEFYFYESDRKKVVDFKYDRLVRVCAGESSHLVPLKISYDGESAEIAAGDCIRVEGKEVYLEPARPLETDWMIKADVETSG